MHYRSSLVKPKTQNSSKFAQKRTRTFSQSAIKYILQHEKPSLSPSRFSRRTQCQTWMGNRNTAARKSPKQLYSTNLFSLLSESASLYLQNHPHIYKKSTNIVILPHPKSIKPVSSVKCKKYNEFIYILTHTRSKAENEATLSQVNPMQFSSCQIFAAQLLDG